MKVILLRDIAKIGKRGEVKEVADGYAVNVLIKKGDAVHATPAEIAKWKSKEDSKKHKKELETDMFVKLIDLLKKTTVTITDKKRDEKGQLFAQVKEADVADAIFNAIKLSVDPKQVIIPTPIKSVGSHTYYLKQGERKESLQFSVK